MGTQIVVDDAKGVLCAGLPPSARAIHRAALELKGSRVVVDQSSTLPLDYPTQTEQARVDAGALKPQGPLLALAGDGFAEEGELARFATGSAPRVAVADGEPVAAYLPEAGELAFKTPSEAAKLALSTDAPRVELRWTFSRTPDEARAAEDVLCSRLAKDTDGYIARLDRRLSIALSRRLLNLPVTPNAITTASLLLGLLGCWWLASGVYAWQLAGVFLLWVCCILDGCDGEVARLKLLCSPGGAAYDLWADHLAHLATFVAIPIGVHRAKPDLAFVGPGLLLVTGFLGCMFSVWHLVLRVPEERRGPYDAFIERAASRDYVYLLAIFVAAGRLEWFMWAAAGGSHAFYLALWALSLRLPKPRPSFEA